jgi:nucleoside-diphosphate-sugar epimerase
VRTKCDSVGLMTASPAGAASAGRAVGTVALAGATGFIGSAIARAFARAGRELVALPRDVALPGEVVASPGEGAAPADVVRADVLIWAAGRRESDLAANRAAHVAAPLAAARATGARRVVYLSSGECYGAAPLPYREDGPALGTSDYARAKLEGEHALAGVAETIALRLGVVYGPGQSPRMLIPEVAAALRAGKRVALSPGEQTRDFVFVDDVADAVVRAVGREVGGAVGRAIDAPPSTINIASGREVRVRDAVTTLCRVLGASEELLGFGDIAVRPGEAMRYVLDVARAADILGWRATTSLEAGFCRLAE